MSVNAEPLLLASAGGAKASNLAFGLRCLPRNLRADALVFYDFCRVVDDIADDPKLPSEKKQALLNHWQTAISNGEDLPPALEDLITRRNLDRDLLLEIVRGCAMDVEPQRYQSYEQLRGYCWRVACAVGLVSVDLFGCRDTRSKVYAEHLGHALQLTNILRDVAEDSRMGRLYLPLEDLDRFGVSASCLLAGKPDGDFQGLMNFEAERAESEFLTAEASLPSADAAALRPARIMHAIYQKILLRMRQDGFRVFEKTYRLSLPEKLWLLVTARCPKQT